MELPLGQVYGEKYRILRLMGQGSMGAVYEGENIRIRRKVAIKTLHAGMAEKGDTLQRFEREAQAAGRIGSKHIVEVLDMGDLPDASRFMVMEYLEGTTLQQHIRSSGRLSSQEASFILQQLLDGLGAAHAAGIIHRDLKPANVFLVRQAGRPDFVKILDFGVSKFSVLSDEMSMTRTGAVLGTPYYMSPEQAKGARGTDARSDLYAVGVILYECITGQVPFSADTFNELLFRIVLESPPPAESFVPDLSPEMAAIIRKSMAREPNERYQTAEEFKQALAEWAAKAEAEALPQFDGMTTMDAKTVMRSGPFPMVAPALRPAPPSTTASGTVMVEPRPAQPSLAAHGTVMIDPAVVPGQATQRSPQANGRRENLPTQPLPQWTDAAPGSPAPGYGGVHMQPGYAPQGVHNFAPGQGVHMQPAPMMPNPYGSAAVLEAAPRSAVAPSQSPWRVMAVIGVAAGLLAGLGAWAMFWRVGGSEGGSETPAAAETAPAAPTTGAVSATAATTSAPIATAQEAAPPTTAAPTSAPTATASVDQPPPEPKSGGTKTTSTAKAATTASPTAAPTGGKGGAGKRTVSQDL